MTRTLFVYWQHLIQPREDEEGRAEAPVLDLAGCFGSPVISVRHVARVARLADLATRGAAGRPDLR